MNNKQCVNCYALVSGTEKACPRCGGALREAPFSSRDNMRMAMILGALCAVIGGIIGSVLGFGNPNPNRTGTLIALFTVAGAILGAYIGAGLKRA